MLVGERLLPGGNSAYEELLAWRQQQRHLRLLQHTPHPDHSAVLGADPRRDNYLYQLWIFYELLDLLDEQGHLETKETDGSAMYLRFRWSTADDETGACCYELRHDRSVPEPLARWHTSSAGTPVPGVRPDFYLWRVEPPTERVERQGTLVWREPGVVWDAKYYREREQKGAPAPPVKRMLADLALLGESYGVLLFAHLKGDSAGNGTERISGYTLAPVPGHDQSISPTQRVAIQQVLPGGDVAATLRTLLDDAHEQLRTPRTPACHGIFLDSLSAAEQGRLLDRTGQPLAGSADDLLLCPKPHIGAWRVDLVSRAQHCCQDAYLCHIVGQDSHHCSVPVRPPRSAEDLLRELQHLFERGGNELALDDETVQAVAARVEHVTRRFAEISGVYRRLEVYTNRLRDMGMHRTLHLLAAAEQESLALAVFLVEQLDSIGATDYSAPAIHVSSVLELENQRRVFACPALEGDGANPKKQTLGTLPFWLRAHKENFREHPEARKNWQRIAARAQQHWQGTIDTDEPDTSIAFEAYVGQLDAIKHLRNKAAHTSVVSRQEYEKLFRITCQSGKLKVGALNALLLAWQP